MLFIKLCLVGQPMPTGRLFWVGQLSKRLTRRKKIAAAFLNSSRVP